MRRVTAVLGVGGVASGMLEHEFYADFLGGDVLPAPLLTGPVADGAAVVFGVCVVGLVGMLVVSAACILLRFLRSSGVERQQMAWVVQQVRREQVVTRFSAQLRNQVELASLTTELRNAVQRTVLPSGVSIWLRRRT
jgi:hypothetical protein